MQKIIVSAICLLILFSSQISKSYGNLLQTSDLDYVIINSHKVFLNIADTPEKRTNGLMFIDKISENQGMVFLFGKPEYEAFWMKNMKMPIDILFIKKDKISKIYKEVPICKSEPCKLYNSNFPVDSVLELKTGFCDKYNVKAGDKISFSEDVKNRQKELKYEYSSFWQKLFNLFINR